LAKLQVIGGINKKSKCPSGNNIQYLGRVKNIDPCYKKCTAAIIPIFTGSGTRLKILEAFAKGLPVVATSKGAEGLEVHPDKNIIICDEPSGFAQKLILLASRPEIAKSLSENAYAFVKEKHDFSTVNRFFSWIDEYIA
jgi:glycosyltransferase involved in cell wall biosynthesis